MSRRKLTSALPYDRYAGDWPEAAEVEPEAFEALCAGGQVGAFELEAVVHCPIPDAPARWAREPLPRDLVRYWPARRRKGWKPMGLPIFPPDWPARGILS